MALALLTGWALQGFGSWKFYGARPIVISIIGFCGWMYVSGRMGSNPDISYIPFIQFVKVLLPILVAMTTIETIAQVKALAWTITLSQGYIAYEFNLAYWNGFNRILSPVAYAGMDNNSVCIAMVTGCGLAFFLGLRDKVKWRGWLMMAVAALLAHCTMFGDSRGAMLSLCVCGVATFFILPRERKPYLAFFLAIVVGLRLAGPAVVERFMTIFVSEEDRDASAQSRLDLWKACWEVALDHPLFGVGADLWPSIAPEYGFKEGKEAHSVWFQTAAEMGFIGVGFLISYYAITCFKLWKLTRQPALIDPWLADAARMVIASLVAFGVAASFVSLEGLELPYYVALLGAATIKMATKPTRRRNRFAQYLAQTAPATESELQVS